MRGEASADERVRMNSGFGPCCFSVQTQRGRVRSVNARRRVR